MEHLLGHQQQAVTPALFARLSSRAFFCSLCAPAMHDVFGGIVRASSQDYAALVRGSDSADDVYGGFGSPVSRNERLATEDAKPLEFGGRDRPIFRHGL